MINSIGKQFISFIISDKGGQDRKEYNGKTPNYTEKLKE